MEILDGLGDKTNFVSQKQLSCNDCVESCARDTTTLQNNNWCVLVTNPGTVPVLFYITMSFKDSPQPPPPSQPSEPNEGDGIKWNRDLIFCIVLVWIVGLFFRE